jgi:hypothetical protein
MRQGGTEEGKMHSVLVFARKGVEGVHEERRWAKGKMQMSMLVRTERSGSGPKTGF